MRGFAFLWDPAGFWGVSYTISWVKFLIPNKSGLSFG